MIPLFLQANLILGGPEFYLEKLLELAPEKMFTIKLASRSVQVVLQVSDVKLSIDCLLSLRWAASLGAKTRPCIIVLVDMVLLTAP